MSRFNPYHETSTLYSAVESWRERSLKHSMSALSNEEQIWTAEHLEEFRRLFAGNLDGGEGTFLSKLKGQLESASPQCVRLAAELMWVLSLFPSNTGPTRKRDNVREIWSWSGSDLDENDGYLADNVFGGIGSTGTAFNTHRWREMAFANDALLDLRAREQTEQSEILGDPWRFVEWLQEINGAGNRQLLHILPHLLFPDSFERISSAGDKLKILEAFTSEPRRILKKRETVEIDKALLELRQKIEAEKGSPIDFYSEDLKPKWFKTASDTRPVESAEGTFAEALLELLEAYGEARSAPFSLTGRISTSMKRVQRWLEACAPVVVRPTINVRVSLGQGGWTKTPWIALLDNRVTTSTQRGIYIVFLIAEDLSATYLTLNQGMTDLVKQRGQKGAADEMRRVGTQSRPQIAAFTAAPFQLDDEIDLRSETPAARNYQIGTIAHVALPSDDLPDDDTLTDQLSSLLNAYDHLIGVEAPVEAAEMTISTFSIEDALEDLFIDRGAIESILDIWKAKKNLVLQGAPGVGKSFVARRLAYCLFGRKDPSRIQTVQFHQSYSYEDFVRGYRPNGDAGFVLQDGIFLDICDRAARDAERPYVLIIDEINRGNLSKVLGELMLLIEHDKRSPDWATKLAYTRGDEADFFVPDNLFILGMMNTADRSLSLVDYALRRRFSFVNMDPQFQTEKFSTHLGERGIPSPLVNRIVEGMEALNQVIGSDRVNLGPGFRIGHSFFTPRESVNDPEAWYQRVIRTEIYPLLEEYWFDDPVKADQWRDRLLS